MTGNQEGEEDNTGMIRKSSRKEPKNPYTGVVDFMLRNTKKVIFGGALGLAGVIGTCQAVYTVPADSQGIIRTFGAYSQTTEPGIHVKIPFWIEEVDTVPVRKVQKEEFGFRTIKSGIESKFIGEGSIDQLDQETISGFVKENWSKVGDTNAPDKDKALEILRKEYLMLTGDLNMVDVEWIVQYQIKDPVAYSFNVREPSQIIRDSSMTVMRKIIGDGSVDEAITIGRIDNEIKAKEGLQKALDQYQTGIAVVTVKLQSVNPPAAVRSSFNEVSRAMQERETQINDARKQYNSVIPEAEGRADAMLKEASAYAINRTNEASGDADRFLQVERKYSQFPEITRTRLYLESMGKVLPALEEKVIVEQKGAEGGFLMHYAAKGGEAK